MLSSKTKIFGLTTFFLFIFCFVLNLVSVLCNIDSINNAGSLKGTMILLLIFEILISIVLIVNSSVGINKLVKHEDRDASFRRVSDGVGGFGVYVAFSEFYALYLVSELYKQYGLTYKVPAIFIVIIVLTIITIILAALGSIKSLKLSPAARSLLLAISSLLMVVVLIIIISQGQQKALTIIEYVFLMLTLFSSIVFAYFCYEDQKAELNNAQSQVDIHIPPVEDNNQNQQ